MWSISSGTLGNACPRGCDEARVLPLAARRRLAGRDRGAGLRKGGERARRFGRDGKHPPFRAYLRML